MTANDLKNSLGRRWAILPLVALSLLVLWFVRTFSSRRIAGSDVHVGSTTHELTKTPPPPPSNPASTDDTPPEFTSVLIHHVIFHESPGFELQAEWLQGRLYPTRRNVVPSLDDPTSFKVEVEEGKTLISLDALNKVLSAGVLKQSQLSNVKLRASGPQTLEIRGVLHKVVPLPVQIKCVIGATADGRLRLRIDSLKVMKIPFKGVLRAMHIKPADLVHSDQSEGMEAHDDAIYLQTAKLLPAPQKLGLVTAVHFTKDGKLVEDYGRHHDEPSSPDMWQAGKKPRNFMRLSGGTLRFGKLTMNAADMVLIDTSPRDWFYFDLAHYRDQLARGDMHMTTNGSLQVFMPDSTKLAEDRASASATH